MLKLNAGFSRKVGEANYGSRGASVNVELELESHLVNDPDGLLRRIRELFELARRSVDAELTGTSSSKNGRNGQAPAGRNGDNTQPVRNATASQLQAIRSMCARQQLDPDHVANDWFGVGGLNELTITEASKLIDELKGAPTNGQSNGAR
jgi:hypothetical protein